MCSATWSTLSEISFCRFLRGEDWRAGDFADSAWQHCFNMYPVRSAQNGPNCLLITYVDLWSCQRWRGWQTCFLCPRHYWQPFDVEGIREQKRWVLQYITDYCYGKQATKPSYYYYYFSIFFFWVYIYIYITNGMIYNSCLFKKRKKRIFTSTIIRTKSKQKPGVV